MTAIKDINNMFRASQYEEAYALAYTEWQANPDDIWEQRKMGWALTYMMKKDKENDDVEAFKQHFVDFFNLSQLSYQNDTVIYDTLVLRVGLMSLSDDDFFQIWDSVKDIDFGPSIGYSSFLRASLKHKDWPYLQEFIEWWNLDNLMKEDYIPYTLKEGKSLMPLAEQAYITYAKCLLEDDDIVKIRLFEPKLEKLEDEYPNMTYPGYYVGKLKVALGEAAEDILDAIIPFVRRKNGEFWVWQLVSELYDVDDEAYMACLLRAVACRAEEKYICKVRKALVDVYLQQGDYRRAKYHLEKYVRTYLENGWKIPYSVQNILNEPWVEKTQSDNSVLLDYMAITDAIFFSDLPEHFAIVSLVNKETKKVTLIYGMHRRAFVRLSRIKFSVKIGDVLSIRYDSEKNGSINVVSAKKVQDIPLLDYCKTIDGVIHVQDGRAFGMVEDVKVPYDLITDNNIHNGDNVSVMAVIDYVRTKDEWNWKTLTIKKI